MTDRVEELLTLPALGFRQRWGRSFCAPRRRHGREVLRQGRPTLRAQCRCGRVLRGSPIRLVVRGGLGPGDLQVGREGLGFGKETKIGPLEMGMRPRGCPAGIQIEPEVWRLVPLIGVAGVVGKPRSRVSRRLAEPPSDANAGPARVSTRTRRPGLRSPPRSHRSPPGILRSPCRLRLGGRTPGRSRSETEWELPIGGGHRG